MSVQYSSLNYFKVTEDINHSCQIAEGARTDTGRGSPLKNSTIFAWQLFILQRCVLS